MAIFGRCRLCFEEAPLQDSHFIPQAAYRLVRGGGRNPHPIVVQTDNAVQTSVQMRKHLLCGECEQRLHRLGEDTFFRLCYRGPGKFRLLDALRANKPLLTDHKRDVYVIDDSLVTDFEQVGYFGTSLFWKSSVHAWNDGNRPVPSIPLGVYEEQFRQFLVGIEPFPEDAALVIEVSDEANRLIQMVGTPGTLKHPTNYLHWIHLCGVRFNLFVGQRMPARLKNFCAFRRSPKIALVAKDQESEIVNLYRDLLVVLAQKSSLKEDHK